MKAIKIVSTETTHRTSGAIFRKYHLSNGAVITLQRIAVGDIVKVYIVPDLCDNYNNKFTDIWDGCYFVKRMAQKYLPWRYDLEFDLI